MNCLMNKVRYLRRQTTAKIDNLVFHQAHYKMQTIAYYYLAFINPSAVLISLQSQCMNERWCMRVKSCCEITINHHSSPSSNYHTGCCIYRKTNSQKYISFHKRGSMTCIHSSDDMHRRSSESVRTSESVHTSESMRSPESMRTS